MGLITKGKSWVDDENVNFTDINGDFDTLYNEVNGNLDNANIKAGAGIVESKISFSGSGHGHGGGSDGKLIQIKRSYLFFVPGIPSVGNDVSSNARVPSAQTANRISIHSKVAPTTSSHTFQIYNITQSKVVASVSLPAGSTDVTSTTMTNIALAAGDILRCDDTAVDSGGTGSDFSVQLDVTEP